MSNFLADALDISKGSVVINGTVSGVISGVTIDGDSPEDIVNVIGGKVRRRKSEDYKWSADMVVLYDNIKDLRALRDGIKFNIELSFTNPDTTDTSNLGQRLIIKDCTVNSHNISAGESSTMKMSGTASDWDIESIT